MQTINTQTIEALKSAGHYFAAGALCRALGLSGYGCHYGLRSELEKARTEFYNGYNAVERN